MFNEKSNEFNVEINKMILGILDKTLVIRLR